MTMFASKTPAEPRRDYLQCRHGDYPAGGWSDDCVICSPVWEEYPHVQHNEPNPILVAFREIGDPEYPGPWIEASWSFSLFGGYREWDDEGSYFRAFTKATEAQSRHAREVLTRLLAFAAVVS